MLRIVGAVVAMLVALALTDAARADVVITVSKMRQSMSVSVNGMPRYSWSVSTGVGGTPSGTFRPQSLDRNHRSSLFGNAPMPYSIFYDGNFAIHGTDACLATRPAGRRAAACGCTLRMPRSLFALVQKEGLGNTRIVDPAVLAASPETLHDRHP